MHVKKLSKTEKSERYEFTRFGATFLSKKGSNLISWFLELGVKLNCALLQNYKK